MEIITQLGGNFFSAEKFSLIKKEWVNLQPYGEFLNDNLDSWASGLCFEMSLESNIGHEVFKSIEEEEFWRKYTSTFYF